MDPEVSAMQAVVELFEDLDGDQRARIISWLAKKYGGEVAISKPTSFATTAQQSSPSSVEFSSFADLFHAAAPPTSKERALLAAFWLTDKEGQEQFAGQVINNMLKHLGYPVSNITDTITQCMKEKPAWIIQTRKSGQSKQSRKTYKLTDAGRRRALSLLQSMEV